jgi:imidazolonepropionase-like amidohydrolase
MTRLPPPIRAKAEYVLPLAQEGHAKAIAAGVKIAFGTDAAVFPHGENAREFETLLHRGMKPLDALRAATLNACDLIGVTDRGTIAPGKLADLIAVPGNPLEDVTVLQHVEFVMKGGAIVKGPGVRSTP